MPSFYFSMIIVRHICRNVWPLRINVFYNMFILFSDFFSIYCTNTSKQKKSFALFSDSTMLCVNKGFSSGGGGGCSFHLLKLRTDFLHENQGASLSFPQWISHYTGGQFLIFPEVISSRHLCFPFIVRRGDGVVNHSRREQRLLFSLKFIRVL